MTVRLLYDITGLDELNKALKEISREVGAEGETKMVSKALFNAAYPVWREAQARAPVSDKDEGAFTSIRFQRAGVKIMGPGKDQPGILRKSIKRQRHRNPDYLTAIVGVGVSQGGTRDNPIGAYYGHFVEFGTVNQDAQPFLRPAIENNRLKVVKTYSLQMGKAIEKEGARIGRKYSGTVTNTSINRRRFTGRS